MQKKNSHARRLEHRAKLRQATAGQLSEEDAKVVQAAETARKEANKPAPVLNRKQRKAKKALKRKAK